MVAAIDTTFEILREAAVLLVGNAPWMGWNLLLALIPLWLAAHLFRRSNGRVGGIAWWFGFVLFVAFLPNAPYVLTDLIHLPRDIADATTSWRMAFIVVPQYVLFCAAGFLSYVVSLIWLVRMLRLRGWSRSSLIVVETCTHLLTAVGIYLGRFIRFNSWDIVSRPGEVARAVADVTNEIGPLAFTAVFFVATCVLYWPSKHVVIAAVTYVRSGSIRNSHGLIERYL